MIIIVIQVLGSIGATVNKPYQGTLNSGDRGPSCSFFRTGPSIVDEKEPMSINFLSFRLNSLQGVI